TRLEDTFSINQVCLINGEPRQVSLKEMISAYIDHQREVIERRTKFDLKKIDDRLHILEGLLKALEDIDNVIAIIKSSPNTTTATNSLM
ncbi:DNA gyrase subunit A, partial [Salmonella enterica]|uniref:DNA gyrase subunit A n=2 Tax=Bacteria TaxID=2 RepID=UPI00266626D6